MAFNKNIIKGNPEKTNATNERNNQTNPPKSIESRRISAQRAPEAEKSIHREEPPNVFDQLFLEDSNTDDCFINYDDLLNNPNENIF